MQYHNNNKTVSRLKVLVVSWRSSYRVSLTYYEVNCLTSRNSNAYFRSTSDHVMCTNLKKYEQFHNLYTKDNLRMFETGKIVYKCL